MSEFFSNLNPFVLCIPLISAFIGWFTNWFAVKAMLYPVEFVGIPPIFGWQGLVPKNTEEMAKSFSELIRDKLIDVEKIFSDIGHDDNEELDKLVDEIAQKVLVEFSTNLAADKWDRAGDKLKKYIEKLIRRNVRTVVEEILKRMGREAKDFMDIRSIVEEAMMEDRGLLGRVLVEIANPEFKFIEMSGLWFGLFFGFCQMFLWISYPISWVLPAAGFFVGSATNWLALTLIFEPREPKKIGPFVLQGLFIKRQTEVAEKFADVIVGDVLTGDNLVKHLTEGSSRDAVLEIIESQVDTSMKEYERDTMVAMLVSKEKLAEAKRDLKERIQEADLGEGGPVQAFADQSERIHAQLKENLHALDAGEFGGMLRPVFQKDEWKLVVAGGAIGIVIGVLQVVYLFGGSF